VSDPGQTLRTPAFLWGPVAVQMILIFAASSIPDLRSIPGGMSDKSGHGIGYGILGAVLVRALAGGRLQGVTWRRAGLAVLLATLYGVTDEFHQAFVPGRSPDRFDVLADCLGAAMTVVVIAGVARAWGILKFSPRSHGQH
jgi:VanZ family protein